MRFRTDSPEECCERVIPELGFAEDGGIVCWRTAGHEGKCEAVVRLAAEADGVCRHCRAPITEPHRVRCSRRRCSCADYHGQPHSKCPQCGGWGRE